MLSSQSSNQQQGDRQARCNTLQLWLVSSLQGDFGRCWAKVIPNKQVQWKELIQQNSRSMPPRALPKDRAAGAEQITHLAIKLICGLLYGFPQTPHNSRPHSLAVTVLRTRLLETPLRATFTKSPCRVEEAFWLVASHWRNRLLKGPHGPLKAAPGLFLMVTDFTL